MIFGPGLIGGSIALALRSRSPETSITIWGRKIEQFQEILQRGAADRVTADPMEAVENADLIILCTPVEAMEGIASTIAPHLKPNAIVTDTGSVKACVEKKLTPILGAKFLGGHPMAGSERSGLGAARADLFSLASCILTPVATTPPAVLSAVTDFWIGLGAHITTMSPQEHDRLVARVSHLPHAMAFALVNLVAGTLPENASHLAGGSYRDGTRVAASDPSLWTGIFLENKTEVLSALGDLTELLHSFSQSLEKEEADSLLDFLSRARDHRLHLPLPSPDELL